MDSNIENVGLKNVETFVHNTPSLYIKDVIIL